MNTLPQTTSENLKKLQDRVPLVHNITNFVVMNSSANILLAIGASPIMAHAIDEVEELVAICSALVLNIGTLNHDWVDAMIRAGKKANQLDKPVVFDPVGAGASKLRTEASRRILDEVDVTVLRGNASEILSLVSFDSKTKGVDSMHGVEQATSAAQSLAESFKMVVGVSGQPDCITNGIDTVFVKNGHPMMTKITGTGCGLSAVTAAFCAVDDNRFTATASAFAAFGLCGQRAAEGAPGLGTFSVRFMDELSRLDPETVADGLLFSDTI